MPRSFPDVGKKCDKKDVDRVCVLEMCKVKMTNQSCLLVLKFVKAAPSQQTRKVVGGASKLFVVYLKILLLFYLTLF